MNLYERIYRQRWDDLTRVGKIWEVLVDDFFQRYIDPDSRVLDIGCGYCHFLNHIHARERVGVDANPLVAGYANEGVRVHITDDLSLSSFPSRHFDWVFLSNFLEHLSGPDQVLSLLVRIHSLLKPGGNVMILQPNFRLVGSAYFDFIDHKTILTERSIDEALLLSGFETVVRIVRFLPYTTKSRFPQHPALVRLYLRIRPLWMVFGRQSFYVARTQFQNDPGIKPD